MNQTFFIGEIESLAACLFTTIQPAVVDEFYNELSHISEDAFRTICKRIKNEWRPLNGARFPLIGIFHDYNRQECAKNQHPVDFGKNEEGMGECSAAFFAVLNEIKGWHDRGLAKYNHPSCPPMDLEHWHRLGRPKTWSPIYDHFIEGLYPNRDNNFAGFCKKYLATLIDAREKKTGKRAAA